jgi:2-polyprenyl-3-methyl-5-hydroxy-6-metoxy-1,4-benzoquinol methylase
VSNFEQVAIEKVQNFWDERPCNIRHSPLPIGTKEYFEAVEQRKYKVEPHIPEFAEFPRWKNKKVLEIGCGIGTDTINFARAGAMVTAIDLSPKSLELAQKRADVYNLNHSIRFFCGDIEKLDEFLPVAPYDLVYSFGVIHHTPHPERAVEKMQKYMTPESELRLMVYSKVSYKLFWIMKEEGIWDMSQLDELIARNSEAQTGCPVTYTYTFNELRSLLHDFKLLEIYKAHIFTWEVEAYKNYEYKKDPVWAGVDDHQLSELEKELGWHILVRAKLKR